MTAEEFIAAFVPETCIILPEWLIEFAKIHTAEALYEASQKVKHEHRVYDKDFKIDKQSILTAYPLENIK